MLPILTPQEMTEIVMGLKPEPPDWQIEGRDWPFREASRFVDTPSGIWHVQRLGAGPPVLLVHGVGAATHSWAPLVPMLKGGYELISIDLPGHGFTDLQHGPAPTRESIARSLASLLETINIQPQFLIGHSAGAAILIKMLSLRLISARALVSINGALFPFPGMAGVLFPVMAKGLYLNPFTAHLFARSAASGRGIDNLIRQTGSALPPQTHRHYSALLRRSGHVAGALRMMANWNLNDIQKDLKRLDLPVLFITGEADKAVRPEEAERASRLSERFRIIRLPGLGHLAHEEAPDQIVRQIVPFFEKATCTPSATG